MRKLLSAKYSTGAFSAAILALRLIFGILIMHHGYGKLIHFNETAQHMPIFFGMSGPITASLIIFAEFFCGLFIIIGLFTRLAAVPLIIAMCVVVFKVTHNDVFGKGEMALLYLGGFIMLLLVGPGRVSVDGMIGK